jgi:hypothetical protein
MKTILAALSFAILLNGCADTGTVRDAAATAGVERQFAGGYDAVAAATLDSVRGLNVSITGTEETPTGLVVLVAKPVNAFSWGEVGRVMVMKSNAPPTAVRVYWEKRSRMQITGTDQNEFAGQLFQGIQTNLPVAAR